MEVLTFESIRYQIINDFDVDYHTIGDLQKIILKFNELSEEETIKHQKKIDAIIKLISDFGTKDVRITDNQANKIISVFKGDECKFKGLSLNEINPYGFIPSQHNKLEKDDIAITLAFTLLSELSYDIMTSSITNHIKEYYEIIDDCRSEKNKNFINAIKDCFAKHGWKNGFQTSPDRIKLAEDIQYIINRYI